MKIFKDEYLLVTGMTNNVVKINRFDFDLETND